MVDETSVDSIRDEIKRLSFILENLEKTKSVKITINLEHIGDPKKGKQWSKYVKSIDEGKNNGFAFQGDFLREGEVELPTGATVLRVGFLGSWKNGCLKAEVDKVTAEGLKEVKRFDYSGQFVSLKKCVQESLLN